ncbi:hypothetical protein PFISCL1PPCAC_21559, partial [Pristionchus fissidentatus]
DFTRCESCNQLLAESQSSNLSSPSKIGHLLACGHVVCVACRATQGRRNSRVHCYCCNKYVESFDLPSFEEIKTSPTTFTTSRWCAHHKKPKKKVEIKCSCGELICVTCALSTHSSHYKYKEFFSVDDQLDEEVYENEEQIKVLIEEKDRLAERRKVFEQSLADANNEIAAKFTRIIAQAISRCLDLLEQSKQLSKDSFQKIDKRIGDINLVIKKLQTVHTAQQTLVMGSHGRGASANFSIRMCEKNAALAICEPVRGDSQLLLARPLAVTTNPVLKISFAANILNLIANVGKGFMTNLGDEGSKVRQIQTVATEIVSAPVQKRHKGNDEFCDLALFSRFHKAVTRHGRYMQLAWNAVNRLNLATDFASIGQLVAPLIILPNPVRSIALRHYVNNAEKDYSGQQSMNAEIPIQGTSRDMNCDPDQPGSAKRIKVEEEEEIDGSNHMKDLMNFAEDCEKAVKYEDEQVKMEDEVKTEVDEGGD